METEKNMAKYESYKSMNGNLKKAMGSGFYYQAIFIEYAILEDRCTSALKHAGLPLEKKKKDGRTEPFTIKEKLNKLKSHSAFVQPYVRKRITLELIDRIVEWKRSRDKLIHDLANIPYDHESVKSIAEEGQELVKIFDNKVKSVNTYFDKQRENA